MPTTSWQLSPSFFATTPRTGASPSRPVPALPPPPPARPSSRSSWTLAVAPVLAAFTVLATACGGGSSAADGLVVQDSAGIPVVVNPSEGLWEEGGAWTVEEVVRIGGEEAGAGDGVDFGMVVGVDLDTDGNIYVADMQARQILVFDAEGTPLRAFGEGGSGPGELGMALQGPFVSGDTIRVVDLQNQRVSRYSATGEPLGSLRLDFASGSIPVRWDETGDGTLVAQFRSVSFTPGEAATLDPTGDPVVTLDPQGRPVDTLVVLPPGQSFTMQGGEMQMRMFESEPMWELGGGRLVSGRNHEFRIEVRNAGGALQRVVTRPYEPRPVTERDREMFYEAILDAFEQQGLPSQAAESMRSMMTFADHYPAFASLLVGPDGTLWAQRLLTGDDLADGEGRFDPQDMGSNEWHVFDAEGRYLGIVAFPGRFQPLRVESDRFWGVARDAVDVQSVVAYRLVR